MIRRAIVPALVSTSQVLSLGQFTGSCEAKVGEDDGFKVSQRLRSALSNKSILRERFKARKTDDDQEVMKIYTLFNSNAKHQFEGEGGLPIARVATMEINCEIQAVADLVEDFEGRKEWDKTCADSQKTLTKDGIHVNYFRGKPGIVVPARTFVYQQSRLNGAVVGKDYSAIVVFCKDASDSLPNFALNQVRGKINSLLILEPLGLSKTKVTYLVEIDANGVIAKWILGQTLSDLFVGDCPVQWLKYLKNEAESKLLDESIGVDEAARLAFHKNLKKKDSYGNSLVDDVGLVASTSKKDLEETVRVLENRLKELRKSEREENLDLSQLRRRVALDLEKARQQLRAAK